MKKLTLLWKNYPKSSMWAFKTLLFVFCIVFSYFSNAQFIQKHTIDPSSDQIALKSAINITAVAIVDEAATEPTRTVLINGSKYELVLDVHAPKSTYFISLPEPANAVTVPQTYGKIDLYTIHSGTPPDLNFGSKNETHCTEVDAIPQSEWRAGLPAPVASPTFHTVTHHIVHHTAGSNSNTNYTQVVRDIYLLHTEINGWDDIGYNFIIAQDGTLYEGRDPGESRTEFEVRGAHFCAKNTGTFGVALLGNYETAQLTEESRERLVNLLSFSLSELNIHPLSTSEHRGENLRAISGHRDGCATLCPGANVYRLLPEIREEVLESLQNCNETLVLNYATDPRIINTSETISFENTSTGYEAYWWKFDGGNPEFSEEAAPVVTYTSPGLFNVTLYGQLGNQVDSLVAENSIQVVGEFPEPAVYPNPTEIGATFQIDFSGDIESINLYDLSGNLVAQYQWGENIVYQSPAQTGFFMLMITTTSETYANKLIIR